MERTTSKLAIFKIARKIFDDFFQRQKKTVKCTKCDVVLGNQTAAKRHIFERHFSKQFFDSKLWSQIHDLIRINYNAETNICKNCKSFSTSTMWKKAKHLVFDQACRKVIVTPGKYL